MGLLTKELRSLRGKMGAHALHMQYDARETTKAARRSFDQRFYREVDPDGELARTDPRELERRVEHARSRYFAGLAYRSVQARQAKAAKKQRPQVAA
jgi:hypothetical protein